MVRRAVLPYQPRTVEAQDDRQVLEGDIMDDLIVGPLGEGRIDVAERLQAAGRQPRRKSHGVFLFDAHIEETFGEGFLENGHAAAGSHGGGDPHDFCILPRKVREHLPEDILVAVRRISGLHPLSGGGVELAGGMPGGGIGLGRSVSFAFFRNDVQEPGALEVPQAYQRIPHLGKVVSVDGTEVPETQGLEDGAAGSAHQGGFGVRHPLLDPVAELAVAEPVPDLFFHLVVGMGGRDFQEIVVQAAGGGVDGDVVVVQDDQQVRLRGAGIVQALPGQATGQGAVADQGDRPLPGALDAGRLREAEGRGNGRGRMSGAEGVVGALVPLGEAADAVPGAVLPESVAPSGQDLMGIGLVPDVEDHFVLGGIIHGVQGYDQFHRTQAGAQMSRILRAALHHILTDLRTKLLEFLRGQAPQIGRAVYLFQIHIITGSGGPAPVPDSSGNSGRRGPRR